MDRCVSMWLAAGVWSATALLFGGLLMWLIGTPDAWTVTSDAGGVVARPGPDAGAAVALATTGLGVLVLTPVVRALLVLGLGLRRREYGLAFASLWVVVLTAVSVVLGLMWR